MELGLKDRIVLVTAASAGIGRATAQAFAREGAKLALCARNAASLESVAKQIRAQYGTDVLALPCDVSDAAQIEAMVAKVVAHFGTVHVLINNAGGPPPGTSGKVTATYTKNGSQFTVALASVEPLKIGGAQLTLAATVTTTDLANTRSVNVTTTSSAVGQLGRTLAHAGSFNAAWDQNQCLTLNGSFTTTENNTQSSTLIADYSRCKNLCPQKGTFTLTTASLTGARVIQVTFGGAATANFTVSGPGGQSSGTVALSCGT